MFGFIITKKRISNIMLVVLLVSLLLCFVLFKAGRGTEVTDVSTGTDSIERIAFIENMGYKVNRDIPEEQKEIEIPFVFSDVYKRYQKLQQKAGYDLEKYAGSKVTLYTYNLLSEGRTDLYAHLLVLKGVIIGGDISALALEDGFIKPLAPT